MAEKKRILVVDDEPEIIKAIEVRLNLTSHKVLTASDAG